MRSIICLALVLQCALLARPQGVVSFDGVGFSGSPSQNRLLVWSDEFDGPSLDLSAWSFQLGHLNDCLQYSTDRPANTKIVNGKLQLVALKESFQGYEYTASVIKTKHALSWRYGRVEALIKLPVSNGFVPAFWLLPEDEQYGWWPSSGEIDIMEHPTTEINKIYGTVHTGRYNGFTGIGYRGSTITVEDAGSAFHLYAVEWTPEKIDFYVDDTKYFTFENEHNGSQSWPFDQPFYIILNMAVGGGWAGAPTASTVFPAIMEVDYVRVYQTIDDLAICGPDFVNLNEESLVYKAPHIDGMQYEWSVPNTAQIISGQNTPQIQVNWGAFSGNVELILTENDALRVLKFPVTTGNNLLKNADFEKGAKYWVASAAHPEIAQFSLSAQEVHKGERSVYVDVKKPEVNPWDIQLSQTNLALKAGQAYEVSFWAKSETNSTLTAAMINASNFSLYASKDFQLTSSWTLCNFGFVAPGNVVASCNIDLGGHTGKYYFDDFQVTYPMAEHDNQVKNADFSAGEAEWIFNTFSPANASAHVVGGEYAVSIATAGTNAWDVHVGQTGFVVENGKYYTMSFDAYAQPSREIFPFVGKNTEPWTVYGEHGNIALTSNRETHAFSFVMREPTDSRARLGFDIGLSAGDVFFDNVVLSKGHATTKVEEPVPSASGIFQLLQNWPNPFIHFTTIRFELFHPGFVSLHVYDIHGRLVKTLLERNVSEGEHQVVWDGGASPAGMYFCSLTVDGMREVKKMALLK